MSVVYHKQASKQANVSLAGHLRWEEPDASTRQHFRDARGKPTLDLLAKAVIVAWTGVAEGSAPRVEAVFGARNIVQGCSHD